MDETLARQVFERLARLDGRMEQFLMAEANIVTSNEKIDIRVTALEIAHATLTGKGQVFMRIFDILVGAGMAFVGAFAFKVFS